MTTSNPWTRPFARGQILLAATLISSLLSTHGGVVKVPAGSVDKLAAAIAKAGPRGTVILKSGLHSESSTVTVGIPVDIIGEPGAVLESATVADPDFPITVQAALHLKNAAGARVQGLWLRPPSGTVGSCAVVLENSPRAQVLDNKMTGVQFGVLVQRADFASISGNKIEVSSAWSLDPGHPAFLIDTEGIVVINGHFVQVTENHVSGGFDGIWLCDRFGVAARNTLTDCYIGLVLCRVPANSYTISGADAFADEPGNGWLVRNNEAHHNDWGIQVTDGTHHNLLTSNDLTANTVYDLELTGDTLRYGYFVPGCHDNVVIQGRQESLVAKDCGEHNTLSGHITLVDHVADPCY